MHIFLYFLQLFNILIAIFIYFTNFYLNFTSQKSKLNFLHIFLCHKCETKTETRLATRKVWLRLLEKIFSIINFERKCENFHENFLTIFQCCMRVMLDVLFWFEKHVDWSYWKVCDVFRVFLSKWRCFVMFCLWFCLAYCEWSVEMSRIIRKIYWFLEIMTRFPWKSLPACNLISVRCLY